MQARCVGMLSGLLTKRFCRKKAQLENPQRAGKPEERFPVFIQFTQKSQPTLFTHDPCKLHEVRQASAIFHLWLHITNSFKKRKLKTILVFFHIKIKSTLKQMCRCSFFIDAVFQKQCSNSLITVFPPWCVAVQKYKTECQSDNQEKNVKDVISLSSGCCQCLQATFGLLCLSWLSGCLQWFLLEIRRAVTVDVSNSSNTLV